MATEHELKYRRMAREKGITLRGELNSIFGVRGKEHLQQLIAEDPHLNNIPLRRFDNLTNTFNTFNAFHPEMRMTLAEGTSLYKQLLRDFAAGEGQFSGEEQDEYTIGKYGWDKHLRRRSVRVKPYRRAR